MYGYGYPPPPWMGYPPPNVTAGADPSITQKHFERGMQVAQRLAQREAREKERADKNKKRRIDEDRRSAKESFNRTFLYIEWFIIGVLAQPLVGPLYQAAINHGMK